MSPIATSSEGRMAQVLREALDAVAAKDLREQLVSQALYVAKRERVPEGGEALRSFVEVHLREAVEYALGTTAADTVVAQLRPIVDLATADEDDDDDVSGIRLSSPTTALDAALGVDPWEDEVTTEAPICAAALEPALVLVASTDETCLPGLREALAALATVTRVDDPLALLDALPNAPPGRVLVVMDCHEPSVRPSTLAAMMPDLPPSLQVVLWGADDDIRAELRTLGDHTERWPHCARESDVGDLVALCAILLG